MSRPFAVLPFLSALGLAACSSAPEIASADPVTALDVAAAQLESGADQEAYTLLAAIDDDELPNAALERYELLWATALYRRGEFWSAYRAIRNFQDDHRFSELSHLVENLHFRIGEALIESDRSYWIFGSDRDDGEQVLTEFVTRYATNPAVPDALQLTGELAFEEERYHLARDRFKRILSEYPSSEWAALAHFRIAISGFRSLVGPAYDYEEMLLTRNELRDYVAKRPERPEFREQATAALATVEGWIAERMALNAAFYRRVNNRTGELLHLRALVRNYPEHPEAVAARERIAALETRAAATEPTR